AGEKSLDLALDIHPATPCCITTDPERMRQVILNLLGNAVKFTQAGGVTLRLKPSPQDGVRLEVEDTGPGIAPGDSSRIFERFQQGSEAGGAGLGLAISRELVALMGGEIGVESKPGQGSLFWVELPAVCPAVAR
ncbi:MAG: ATP-binding protein, partial [Pseudomonadota bacterium]